MTQDANHKKLKKMGNKDWFLSYYIIFIPYFISSYAGVTDSQSIVTWLDLRYSLSLVLIIGKGFGGYYTPEDYSFGEIFKCHMDFALGLVLNDRFII